MMFKLIFISALLISCTFARPADDDKIDDLDDWDLEDAVDAPKETSDAQTVMIAAEPQGPVSHIQKIPPRNAKPTEVVATVGASVDRKRRDTEIRHTKRDAKTKRNKKTQPKDMIPEEMSGEAGAAAEKPSQKPKRPRKGGKGKKKPAAIGELENPEQDGDVKDDEDTQKPKQKPKKQRKPKKPKQAKHRRGRKQNRPQKTTTAEPSLSETVP